MPTVLSLRDWRDVAVSSLLGGLAYVLADIYLHGRIEILAAAAYVGSFGSVFLLMQLLRKLS